MVMKRYYKLLITNHVVIYLTCPLRLDGDVYLVGLLLMASLPLQFSSSTAKKQTTSFSRKPTHDSPSQSTHTHTHVRIIRPSPSTIRRRSILSCPAAAITHTEILISPHTHKTHPTQELLANIDHADRSHRVLFHLSTTLNDQNVRTERRPSVSGAREAIQ